MASSTSQVLGPPEYAMLTDEALLNFRNAKAIRNNSKDPRALAADVQHLKWVQDALKKDPLIISLCRSTNTSRKGLERTLEDLTFGKEHMIKDKTRTTLIPAGDGLYRVSVEDLYQHLVNNRIAVKDSKILPIPLIKALFKTDYQPLHVSFRLGKDSDNEFYHTTRYKIHHLPIDD